MKSRCKNCFVVLRAREINASNYHELPYEVCSDCLLTSITQNAILVPLADSLA
jgi:hypothetical protein